MVPIALTDPKRTLFVTLHEYHMGSQHQRNQRNKKPTIVHVHAFGVLKHRFLRGLVQDKVDTHTTRSQNNMHLRASYQEKYCYSHNPVPYNAVFAWSIRSQKSEGFAEYDYPF
jgi:hypothetical protein